MTIEGSWISMREHWSGLGTTDHDGVKTWDTSLLELGFTGANITCQRSSGGSAVYAFSVAAASDWYVSQRADWFDATQPTTLTMWLTLSASGEAEFPDGLDNLTDRIRMLRGLYVYCKRQSDDAIAVFDCEGADLSALPALQSQTG